MFNFSKALLPGLLFLAAACSGTGPDRAGALDMAPERFRPAAEIAEPRPVEEVKVSTNIPPRRAAFAPPPGGAIPSRVARAAAPAGGARPRAEPPIEHPCD